MRTGGSNASLGGGEIESGVVARLKSIRARMEKAAERSGRRAEDVRLVAVAKRQPLELVREVVSLGVKDIGENRIQEALPKIDLFPQDIKWHFLGHLQKNKVKHFLGRFYMLHSLDSLELATEISKRAVAESLEIKCLVQVNLGREEQKSGIYEEELASFLRALDELPGIVILGLMTLPPYDPEPEKSRKYFKRLRELRDEFSGAKFSRIDLRELSMGMSNDFEVAIEEGATIVRIGTALFGPRQY